MNEIDNNNCGSRGVTIWLTALEVALVFMVFAIHAGSVVPDVNEPHYLCKAKHYWNSDWCQGDFFLETADAHHVFYWTIGWLTQIMPLASVAWWGRLLCWALLAAGWRRLSFSIVPRPMMAVLTAALMVMINSQCHVASEWIVGGVEAKGFAYALVLFALAEMVHDRPGRAFLFLGVATSFHVLVGGWSIVAALFAWWSSGSDRPRIATLFPALAGCLFLALPGLIPAISLSLASDADTVAEANRIYVNERLYHHLLPAKFRPEYVARFITLFALWLVASDMMRGCDRLARLRRFVFGAMWISLVGLLFAFGLAHWPDLSARVLRYYWFRLADVALAIGVSMTIAAYLIDLKSRRTAAAGAWLVGLLILCVWFFGNGVVNRRGQPPLAESAKKVANYPDWLEVCEWIRESGEIPDDACFITPRSGHTFKWHTGRREVATWKDIPQQSDAIVKWYARINHLYGDDVNPNRRFVRSLNRHSRAKFLEFRDHPEYGATHVLTRSDPILQYPELKVVFRNQTYVVYEFVPGPNRPALP